VRNGYLTNRMLYRGESCSSVVCLADSVCVVSLILGCFLATGLCVYVCVCVCAEACVTHLETSHIAAHTLNASVARALD
jgi:hypothetical protein